MARKLENVIYPQLAVRIRFLMLVSLTLKIKGRIHKDADYPASGGCQHSVLKTTLRANAQAA
jgi:hypothetical protein